MKGLVAVVILNYCQSKLTLNCLRSLAHQNYQNLVVIVTDNSPEEQLIPELDVKKIFPSAHVIYNHGNRGFSAGCNPGIRKGMELHAEFIWLLNNDTEIKTDTLSLLVKKMESSFTQHLFNLLIYIFL